VAADVEQKALVVGGAADPADVLRVLLQDQHLAAGLGQLIGGGQARRAGADDQGLERLRHSSPLGGYLKSGPFRPNKSFGARHGAL
jgi:hypothetical protein